MNLNTKMFANDDNSGNRIYMRVFYNEKGENQNATLHLKLKEEKAPRQIGNFDFITRTFFCRRNTAKHLHRKTNSFGFNWTILNDNILSVENVYIIVDDTDHYQFPIQLIKEYGKFLNFKQQGFELQRFMSFELIKQYSKVPRNPKKEDNDTSSDSSSENQDK